MASGAQRELTLSEGQKDSFAEEITLSWVLKNAEKFTRMKGEGKHA